MHYKITLENEVYAVRYYLELFAIELTFAINSFYRRSSLDPDPVLTCYLFFFFFIFSRSWLLVNVCHFVQSLMLWRKFNLWNCKTLCCSSACAHKLTHTQHHEEWNLHKRIKFFPSQIYNDGLWWHACVTSRATILLLLLLPLLFLSLLFSSFSLNWININRSHDLRQIKMYTCTVHEWYVPNRNDSAHWAVISKSCYKFKYF